MKSDPSVMNLKASRECYYIYSLQFGGQPRWKSFNGTWILRLGEHM